MTDYVLTGMILGTVVTSFIFGIKYSSEYFTERLKIRNTEKKKEDKPKSFFESIEDLVKNAKVIQANYDNDLKHLLKEGCNEEQMKKIKQKKQFADFVANDYVQMIAPGAIDLIKSNLKGIIKI